MDDKLREKRLKDRFENYKDPQFDAENWRRLSDTLDQLPTIERTPFFYSKKFLAASVGFLLVSHIFLSGFIYQQNSRIERLLIAHDTLKKSQHSSRFDSANNATIIGGTLKNGISNSAEENGPLSIHEYETLEPENLASEIETIRPHMNAGVRKQRSADHDIKEQTVHSSVIVESGKDKQDRSQPYLVKELGNNLNLSSIVLEEDLISTERKIRQIDYPTLDDKENKFAKDPKEKPIFPFKFSPGISISLPRVYTDITHHADPGLKLGADLKINLSQRFDFITGLTFAQLSYKIDDHGRPEELQELLQSYPAISEDQSIMSLHEVFSDAYMLEIPLHLRFNFTPMAQFHPYIEGGILSRWFLKQSFEYEYTLGEDRISRTTEVGTNKLRFSGVHLAIGHQFDLVKNLKGEFSMFIQKDLIPQGSEGRLFTLWGISAAVRINP